MLREQYVTAGELAERLGVAMAHFRWLAARPARYLPARGWGGSGSTAGTRRKPSRSGTGTTGRQGRAWRGRELRRSPGDDEDGHGVAPKTDPGKPASQPGRSRLAQGFNTKGIFNVRYLTWI